MPNITLPGELRGLSLPGFNLVPPTEAGTEIKEDEGPVQQHRFGLTPEKAAAIPTHLRTSSTQVEPATPPKWLLDQEAAAELLKAEQAAKAVGTAKVEPGFQSRSEEKEARPNWMSKADLAVVKKGPKKERPTGEQHSDWSSSLTDVSSFIRAEAIRSRERETSRSKSDS